MTSGTCGENLKWTLDDGTLIISGTGNMKNYRKIFKKLPPIKYAPWHDECASIQRVVINNGVTSICDVAFRGCSSLKKIYYKAGSDFANTSARLKFTTSVSAMISANLPLALTKS